MGNCFRRESRLNWGGDDWVEDIRNEEEEEEEIEKEETGSQPAKTASSKEVKIKITRKQLEELLGKASVREITVRQVLTHLIDGGGEADRRPWKPALKSIPEVRSEAEDHDYGFMIRNERS